MERVIVTNATGHEIVNYFGYNNLIHYCELGSKEFEIKCSTEDGVVMDIVEYKLKDFPFEYKEIVEN